jgi:hypothetical protein
MVQKTLGVSLEAYGALLDKKSDLVKTTGKSSTYSKIILDLLGVDSNE